MTSLKTLVENFQEVHYPRVIRNSNSYIQSEEFIKGEISRLLGMYEKLTTVNQTARLIRDGIDMYLRRYHGYSIEGNIGSHYRQKDVTADVCDFEHVIPQAKIRDLLIQQRITIDQAMNPPTCLIHKDLHRTLKEEGWASKTPDIYYFWRRYTNIFNIEIEVFNGRSIDTSSWNLDDHYSYFSIT